MQIPGWIRGAASVCALGLVAGPMVSSVAHAAPTTTPSPQATTTATRTPATAKGKPAETCTVGAGQEKLTILSFNDFHGRIAKSGPDTVGFFGDIEKLRTAAGGDSKTLLLSSGDNIGGSLFESASLGDNPAIDVLNAAALDVSAVGNHEYDKGQTDLNDRVQPRANFEHLAANITRAGGAQTNDPKPYQVFDKSGVKVAVIGAVTGDLPALVSPDGLKGLTVSDPVGAVNKYAAALKDGKPENGEADVIIASYHEGALGSSTTYADEAARSAVFKKMAEGTDARVSAIYNAHTHQTYAYDVPAAGGSRPLLQSGSYAGLIGKVELVIDPATKSVGSCYTRANVKPTMTAADAVAAYPRAATIQTIVDKAIAQANVVGAQVIGSTTEPITRALPGGKEDRARESALSNLVAQMFKDQLGKTDPNFIGVQNPGGTRDDFDKGDITYKEAASVLSFANSLYTTQITGAQLKTVLEQQWQREPGGGVPSRPYLQLGLSQNAHYSYDESRAEGDRITGIWVSGKPVDPKATYTIGSGSFLISGGDNFRELAKGTNTKDSGRVDLEAWVDYIKQLKTVAPDFGKQAVSVKPTPTTFEPGTAQTFAVGVPLAGGKAADTLDQTSTGAKANTTLVAEFIPDGGQPVKVGEAKVDRGQVPAISVKIADPRKGILRFTAQPNTTVAQFVVDVTGNCGLKDNGCFNVTPEGSWYWSDHSPRSLVKGEIFKKWGSQGWENGELGYPVISETCGLKESGCFQNFQGGSIYWTPDTGAHIVKGEIHRKWASQGWENGPVGYPTTDEFCGLRDGGCGQHFQNGSIYWSPATGAHVVLGALKVAYAHHGWEASPLGYPTSDEFCGLRDGGCGQRFQGGLTLFSPASGAHAVFGAIYQEYERLGWETGKLGYPVGSEICGLKDNGCFQVFQGGSIYWSPASGAHAIWGNIRDHWGRNGWENGRYGYPTSAETCGPVGSAWECRQNFQRGRITWNSQRGFI